MKTIMEIMIFLIKNLIKNKDKTSLQSFSLLLILNQLGIDNNTFEITSNIGQIFLGFFLLSLVATYCLINIIGYIIVSIFLIETDVENKYPKFRKIINYFKKMVKIKKNYN